MSFVISGGQLEALQRPYSPSYSSSGGRLALSTDYFSDYADLYRSQPHVRTVISFLARNIAQIGIHSFERVSDTERRRLDPTRDPLAILLRTPVKSGPGMRGVTRYRMLESLVSDLGIYDVACQVKLRTPGYAPGGLVRIPPKMLEPRKGSGWFSNGVTVRGNAGKMDLDPDRIVLFHGYSPDTSSWGVSPMETLRQILAEEWAATEFRTQLWANGARTHGVIERPVEAPQWKEPARERFRNDWRGLYTGHGPGAGGTPVLEDGMQFKPTQITPLDAQYLESRKLTREEVAAAFHIPLPLVGILDHATFSNIEEQHKHLYQDTLGPWLTMIEEELALQLVPDFDSSGRLYVEFNLAEKLKGTFEEQASIMQTMVGAPVMTRNEGRARLNLPLSDDPAADELIVPLNVLVGGLASPTDTAPDALDNAEPKAVLEAFAVLPSSYGAKHEEIVRGFFDRQKRAVSSRLGAKSAQWWDGPRWDRELSAQLFALGTVSGEYAAGKMLERVGFDPELFEAGTMFAPMLEAAGELAQKVNADTREKAATGELDVAWSAERLAATVETAMTRWVDVAAAAVSAQIRLPEQIGA